MSQLDAIFVPTLFIMIIDIIMIDAAMGVAPSSIVNDSSSRSVHLIYCHLRTIQKCQCFNMCITHMTKLYGIYHNIYFFRHSPPSQKCIFQKDSKARIWHKNEKKLPTILQVYGNQFFFHRPPTPFLKVHVL